MKALIRVVTGVLAMIFRPIAASACAVTDWLGEYITDVLGSIVVVAVALVIFLASFFGVCVLIDLAGPSPDDVDDPRLETNYSATVVRCPNCGATDQKAWQEKGKSWNELTSFNCDECGVHNQIRAFLLCKSCKTLELTTPEGGQIELHKRPYCTFHWWCAGDKPDLIIVDGAGR